MNLSIMKSVRREIRKSELLGDSVSAQPLVERKEPGSIGSPQPDHGKRQPGEPWLEYVARINREYAAEFLDKRRKR